MWWAASCASLDQSALDKLAGQSGKRTVFRITVCNARDIMAYSARGDAEKEWLLPPGTQLRVTGVAELGDVELVDLEEVGKPFMLQEFEDEEDDGQVFLSLRYLVHYIGSCFSRRVSNAW